MAQYLYDTYGKFPATIPSILVAGYVQAQHIDTDFYDAHFQPGAYLDTHVGHVARVELVFLVASTRPRRAASGYPGHRYQSSNIAV
jgi:hypothetical protein